MTALHSTLHRRRFELFHVSLVVVGVVIGTDPLLALLTGPGSIGGALFDALGVVAGVGFVGWGLRDGWRRDREEWADDFAGHALVIWLVIGTAAVFVGAFVYVLGSRL